MSKYRGGYRMHRTGKPEDKRGCSYVESGAKLAKQFEAALERKRQELARQREEIRRIAAVRRAG